MNSILPKYDDLDRVAEEAAIKIFMEDMKKCNKCGEVKSTGEFSKDKSRKDGLEGQCKACRKAYYKANKDKIAESQKAYREANKDVIAEREKSYRDANKEQKAERNKAYQKANKEKLAEKKKAYYKKNKEKIAESQKAYYESKRNKRIEQLKQIIEPNTDGKWIYIMQCGIYNKIGISDNPLWRVEQIESMTQAPAELIYLAKANYGRTIDTEQIIHHELSSLNVPMPYANGKHEDHVSKEWFFGSLDKMVEIVGQYATISEVE